MNLLLYYRQRGILRKKTLYKLKILFPRWKKSPYSCINLQGIVTSYYDAKSACIAQITHSDLVCSPLYKLTSLNCNDDEWRFKMHLMNSYWLFTSWFIKRGDLILTEAKNICIISFKSTFHNTHALRYLLFYKGGIFRVNVLTLVATS